MPHHAARHLRSRASRMASGWALCLLTLACQAVGQGPPCAAEEYYPLCSAQGDQLLECVYGEVLAQPCPDGESCLDIVDPSGARFSQCLPEGTLWCDASLYTATCWDAYSVIECQAPQDYPAAGHTVATICELGTSCVQGVSGASCQAPAGQACDPDTYVSSCLGADVLYCDPDTNWTALDSCPAPQTCQLEPEGPQCVRADTGCDPQTFSPSCVGADILICDPATLETAVQACPVPQTCRTQDATAQCLAPDPDLCDPQTTQPQCNGNSRVFCTPEGRLVTQACGSQVCRISGVGAFCVPPTATPCDPASYLPLCLNLHSHSVCNPATGFTVVQPCPIGQTCRMLAQGALCAAGLPMP